MDTNQNNNNNSLSPMSGSSLGSTPLSAPAQGLDINQTFPANPAPLSSPTAAPAEAAGLTSDTNFAPSITTPTSGGDLSFPSKSPWDSSSSVNQTTSSLSSSPSLTSTPTDVSSIPSAQSPAPLSLPADNQPISLTPPTTNVTPAPVDFNSLTSNSGVSQPTPLSASGAGDSSSTSSTTWSPQSMDSTQSVPVNPQVSQPMTDSSAVGGSPLPSSGFNLSDQSISGLSMPGQGSSPTSMSTPDSSAMSAPAAPTDPTALPSMNMPTGGSDGSSPTPAWPATTSTDSVASLSATPPVDSSVMSPNPGGSNPFGVEAAPTDLSHLVDSSMPAVPSATVAGGGPAQFEPSNSGQPVPSTISTSQPSASISGEGGTPGLPKAIIFLVIGVLLIVAAALAYIFLGVGKPMSASVPIDQHLTNPPVVPTTAPSTSGSSSDSATLTITPAPTSSSSASSSGSAIDLMR